MSDSIPDPDPDFDLWFFNFNNQFSLNGTTVGFTAADVTAVTTAYNNWHAKFTAQVAAQAAAESSTQAKDTQRKVSEAVARSYAQQLQKKPLMTDALRASFKINIPKAKAPIPPPTAAPLVLLEWGIAGRMRVHFGTDPSNEHDNGLPDGVRQVMLEFAPGLTPPATEDGWKFLAVDTNSPYSHRVASPTPQGFTYRACYMNPRGELGPWSAPASGTISP